MDGDHHPTHVDCRQFSEARIANMGFVSRNLPLQAVPHILISKLTSGSLIPKVERAICTHTMQFFPNINIAYFSSLMPGGHSGKYGPIF